MAKEQEPLPEGHYRFTVPAPKGLEEVLTQELKSMGIDAHPGRGSAHWTGPLETGYRAVLWSRVGTRVLMEIRRFEAPNFDKLYGGVRSIHWTNELRENGTLAVDFTSRNSELEHTQFGAQRTKDAIVDQFMRIKGERPSVDLKRPDLEFTFTPKDRMLRSPSTCRAKACIAAPIAALRAKRRLRRISRREFFILVGWNELTRESPAEGAIGFVDPFCGSGTLAIEAALMAVDFAPGLMRDYFGFQGWLRHDAEIAKKLFKKPKIAGAWVSRSGRASS